MKHVNILWIGIFLLSTLVNHSQTLGEIINDPTLNYFEIHQQIEQNKATIFDFTSEGMIKRYHPWEWFWDTRVDYDGTFNTNKEKLKQKVLQPTQTKETEVWQSLGPKYEDFELRGRENYKHLGQVTSIWVNPTDNDIIYIGTNNSGLWKTENAGLNWRLLTPNWRFGVKDITVQPDNFNIMYIASSSHASGYLKHGYNGLGVFKTTDGGESWTKLQDIQNSDLIYTTRVLMHPTNYNTIYSIATNKVFKSTNAGATFTEKLNIEAQFYEGHFGDAKLNSNNPNQITIAGQTRFYVSDDAGETWVNRIDNLYDTDPYNYSNKIAVDYHNGVLYALYSYGIYPRERNRLKKSTDNGLTWQLISSKKVSANAVAIFLEIINENIFWLGGVIPWVTYDGGKVYYNPDDDLHVDVRDIHFPDPSNPDIIYIATDGGINKTTDSGATWEKIYGDLVITESYAMDVSKQDPNYYIIGNGDNGTYRHTEDGWKHVIGGDGGDCLISWENDNTNYAASNMSIAKSTNGFNSYKRLGVKASKYDAPLIQHPTKPNTLYLAELYDGAHRLSKSTNAGATWNRNFDIVNNERVTALAISKSNPNTLYYARKKWTFKPPPWKSEFKLFKTENDGTSWIELTQNIIDEAPNMEKSLRLTEICVNPTDPNMVWVTFGNFSEGNRVFQTNNGGTTWTNITYNLENIPVNTVIYDEMIDVVFIGNDFGVYYRTNASNENADQTWEYFADLPYVFASDLKINSNRELMLSTYGRGIWKVDLACVSVEGTKQISGTEVWENQKSIVQDIELLQGAHLTIKGETSIALDKKIIIHPGAKLIIDGGILTNKCGGQWKGIQVLGNKNLLPKKANQGVIELINGGIIENAETAI